ncbi:MAG: hypothetical protein AB7G06_05835 [Bdellovibrionales bacterium]
MKTKTELTCFPLATTLHEHSVKLISPYMVHQSKIMDALGRKHDTLIANLVSVEQMASAELKITFNIEGFTYADKTAAWLAANKASIVFFKDGKVGDKANKGRKVEPGARSEDTLFSSFDCDQPFDLTIPPRPKTVPHPTLDKKKKEAPKRK